jgi:hypothetical protein
MYNKETGLQDGVLIVGKKRVPMVQLPFIGDKVFMKEFDKPIRITRQEYSNNMILFYGE